MAQTQFKIFRCGMDGVQAVIADTAHSFGRHTHDQFGIGVILRGAQKSMSGRGVVEAQAGDVVSVNPGEVHDGLPLGDQGRAWQMLYFDPAALSALISDLTESRLSEAELSHPTMRNPVAAGIFRSLFRAMVDPHGGVSEIERRENLLLLLARLIDSGRRPNMPAAPGAIVHAMSRIDDDPSASLSLAELSAISGLSQFQLVRSFSKATGLTPHAYLIQRRLQQARRMLVRGSPLADAALASGFADQSHMTRLFVRTYGMSPGRYFAALT
jgi:AraC-like DNA-binding protein